MWKVLSMRLPAFWAAFTRGSRGATGAGRPWGDVGVTTFLDQATARTSSAGQRRSARCGYGPGDRSTLAGICRPCVA